MIKDFFMCTWLLSLLGLAFFGMLLDALGNSICALAAKLLKLDPLRSDWY